MNESSAPRSTRLLIWMIISQVLMLASLLVWLVLAGLSLMAFDSVVPGETWAILAVIWSYPILPIALMIAAWIAYKKRKTILAVVLSVLSFAPPFLCILVIFIIDLAWYA